jgi:hypothetical protein
MQFQQHLKRPLFLPATTLAEESNIETPYHIEFFNNSIDNLTEFDSLFLQLNWAI